MKRYISILLFLAVLLMGVNAQSVTDYRLLFDKCDMGSGALRVECAFTIDFAGQDSLKLDFGGNFEEMAVDELIVAPDYIRYAFDPLAKRITFYRTGDDVVRVEMEYIFMNLTSVFMYNDKGAEVWECIYTDAAEFYYPMHRGMSYRGEVRFAVPHSMHVVSQGGSDATQWQSFDRCVALNFAFLGKLQYEMSTMQGNYHCDVYQLKGRQADEGRYNELCRLVELALQWFETEYGESYVCPQWGVHDYPAFVFHSGNASFNRYNMGFISASQEKFATYPDIYPLIHEIGHRWMGEYSMFIDSGTRGYAFVMETLNEFMTMQCIKDIEGVAVYDRLIEECRAAWKKIEGTERDVHPVDVVKNNNIPVTYRKGVVMLDSIARQVGYDKVRETIVRFYHECKGKPCLQYEDFERMCDFSL